MVYHWSYIYGVDAGDMLRLAMCESGQQPYVRNGSQGETGVYQLHPRGVWLASPWRHLGFEAMRDPELNVRVTAWLVAHGYGRHWTCWAIRNQYAPF